MVVIVATIVGGIWIFLARRRQVQTPALAAVTSLLGDGMIDGRRVSYVNKAYRSARWTELTVAAPGAKVALKMTKQGGDYAIEGAPDGRVKALTGELRGTIDRLHPKSIELGDDVKIVADHLVEDAAEGRALVQLGLDLAAKAAGGVPAKLPELAARQDFIDDQAAQARAKTIGALVVLGVLAAGAGLLGWRMWKRRRP